MISFSNILSKLDDVSDVRAAARYLLGICGDRDLPQQTRGNAANLLTSHAEQFIACLSGADLNQLRDVSHALLHHRQHAQKWDVQIKPEQTGYDLSGEFVKFVEIEANGHQETDFALTFSIPASPSFLARMEYTLTGETDATLSITAAETQQVLATTHLSPGVMQVAEVDFDVPQDVSISALELKVLPDGGNGAFRFFGLEVQESAPKESSKTVSEVLEEQLNLRGGSDPSSVFHRDGDPLATPSDLNKLAQLQGKYAGERIFIMGNGPSLNDTPLDVLKGEYVFGLNRVSLLFDRIDWRPQFFTAFDTRVVPDNAEEFSNLDIPHKFFCASHKPVIRADENTYWHHVRPHLYGFERCFGPGALFEGFGGGGTIGVIAIQLAYFMGFREIYLIGTDVSYVVPSSVKQVSPETLGDGVALELESTKDDDVNHFAPNYFGAGKKWHHPNVEEMKIGFARCAQYIHRYGGTLKNATVGGALDEVERVDFRSLF